MKAQPAVLADFFYSTEVALGAAVARFRANNIFSFDSVISETTMTAHLMHMVWTLAYVAVGIFIFLLGFILLEKILPFSFRKEIEEDQNTALAIMFGSVVIGLSIIIAAGIHG